MPYSVLIIGKFVCTFFVRCVRVCGTGTALCLWTSPDYEGACVSESVLCPVPAEESAFNCGLGRLSFHSTRLGLEQRFRICAIEHRRGGLAQNLTVLNWNWTKIRIGLSMCSVAKNAIYLLSSTPKKMSKAISYARPARLYSTRSHSRSTGTGT